MTLGQALADGLLALGHAAPRFPGADNRESAAKFLALWLRAHNPSAARTAVDHRLHAQNLARFRAACDLLVRGAAPRSLPPAPAPGSELVDQILALAAQGPRASAKD